MNRRRLDPPPFKDHLDASPTGSHTPRRLTCFMVPQEPAPMEIKRTIRLFATSSTPVTAPSPAPSPTCGPLCAKAFSHSPLSSSRQALGFDIPVGFLSGRPITATLPQSHMETGLEREPVVRDGPVLHQRHLPSRQHPPLRGTHRPGMCMMLTSYCVKRVGMSLYVSRYEMFLPRQVRWPKPN